MELLNKHTVTPGNYIYNRPRWEKPYPCKIIKLGNKSLYIKFKGSRPEPIEDVPEDAIFKTLKNKHGGARPDSGPKTKANKGKHRAKKLSVTIPWQLWIEINEQRLPGEGDSKLIQRLLAERS